MSDPDSVKRVVAEWVLINGKLPGFDDRVKASLPGWKTVGPGGMTVYRGQGGVVRGAPGSPPPSMIVEGIRPVLATSRAPWTIKRYAGKDCCMFMIRLLPGTRYINVSAMISFLTKENQPALAVKNTVLEAIQSTCAPPKPGWFLSNETPLSDMRRIILERCAGRIKHVGPGEVEYVPPEEEVMVYAVGGSFSPPTPIANLEGKLSFEVTFTPPKAGGRRRTQGTTRRRRRTRRVVRVR
jgi:hypothetical protein